MVDLHVTAAFNVEATLNAWLRAGIATITLPTWLPAVTFATNEAEAAISLPSVSAVHMPGEAAGRYSGRLAAEGVRSLRHEGLMDVSVWASRANANWEAQLRYMQGMVEQVVITNPTVVIKNYLDTPAAPVNANFRIVIAGLSVIQSTPQDNPDVERRRLLIRYHWWECDNYEIPAAPTLTSPANGVPVDDTTPDFSWSVVAGAAKYHIQIDDNSDFSSPVVDDANVLTNSYTPLAALDTFTLFYWRVSAINAGGSEGDWSAARTFRVEVYIQSDDFTTDAAAPLDASASAEPGPGRRNKSADTTNLASIVRDTLLVSGNTAVAYADPAYVWPDAAGALWTRQAGRAAIFRVIAPTTISPAALYSWATNLTVALASSCSLYFQSGNALLMQRNGNAANVGTVTPVTTYLFAIVMRAAGYDYYVLGGNYSQWTRLQTEISASLTTAAAPAFHTNGNGKSRLDHVKIADIPQMTDTDLLVLNATSVADGATFTGTADGVYHMGVTTPNPLANSAELQYRRLDDNNYFFVRATSGGALQAGYVLAGSPSTPIDLASQFAIASNYTIEVQCIGNVHRIYLRTASFQSILKGTVSQTTAMDTATAVKINRASYTVPTFKLWAATSTKYNALPSGTIKSFMPFGDSKSAAGVEWPAHVLELQSDANLLREYPARIATIGDTTADAKADVDANLAAAVGTPDYVFYNLGANDVSDWAAQRPTIVTNMRYIWDAIHAKWPSAIVYVMRPWVRNYLTQCNEYASDVETARVGRETWVLLGPDERVFLEGGDDGATNTDDGIHPNAAGNVATAQAWITTVGL